MSEKKANAEQILQFVKDTIKQINDSEHAAFIWIVIALIALSPIGWFIIPLGILAWVAMALIDKI